MNKLLELYNKIPVDKQGHLTIGLILGLALGASPLLALLSIAVFSGVLMTYQYISHKDSFGVAEKAYDTLAAFIGTGLGIAATVVIHLFI